MLYKKLLSHSIVTRKGRAFFINHNPPWVVSILKREIRMLLRRLCTLPRLCPILCGTRCMNLEPHFLDLSRTSPNLPGV